MFTQENSFTCSNFLNDLLVISERTIFGPPPPINVVHGSYMKDMDIIDHVAAAPCPPGLS